MKQIITIITMKKKKYKKFFTILSLILMISMFVVLGNKLTCYAAESPHCSHINCNAINCAGKACECGCPPGSTYKLVAGTCDSFCNATSCRKDVLCTPPTPTPKPDCESSSTLSSVACKDRTCGEGRYDPTCTSTLVGCRCCPGNQFCPPTPTPTPEPTATPEPTPSPTPTPLSCTTFNCAGVDCSVLGTAYSCFLYGSSCVCSVLQPEPCSLEDIHNCGGVDCTTLPGTGWQCLPYIGGCACTIP